MDKYCLKMKWDYTYDKEGTWFDNDSGQEIYDLAEGTNYKLPHISEKCVEIQSVSIDGDTVRAVLYVGYHTVDVRSDGDPAVASVDHSYSVAGDSVDQSLTLIFTIEKK